MEKSEPHEDHKKEYAVSPFTKVELLGYLDAAVGEMKAQFGGATLTDEEKATAERIVLALGEIRSIVEEHKRD